MAFQKKSLRLLSASSQYASITDAAQTGLQVQDFTIEAWIKLRQLPSTAAAHMTIISKYDFTNNDREWLLQFRSDNTIRAYYSENGSDATFIASTSAVLTSADVNKWIHIAVSVDASAKTGQFYKDTETVPTNAGSGTPTTVRNGSSPVVIGANNEGAADRLDGLIKLVRVFNDIRSSGEIISDSLAQTVSDANLVAEWALDGSYADTSGNSNTLTPSGSPIFVPDVPFSGINDSDWSNKIKLKIPSSKVSGSVNLTNFPVLLTDDSLQADFYLYSQSGEIYNSWLMDDPLLKAYYRFESGALTTDSSGNGHTLTPINTPTETTGKRGGGVAMASASSQAYSHADNSDFKPTGPFSAFAWIKTSTSGRMIINAMSQNSNVAGWFIDCGLNGANKANFVIGNNTGVTPNTNYKVVSTVNNITDGNWHFVVGVWDGATMKIYLDGILEASVAWANAPAYAGTTYVRIGCDNQSGSNSSFYNGDMDEVGVIHRALSDEEIQLLHSGGADLRLTLDSDGEEEIPFEIVWKSTTSNAIEAWAKIPTVYYNQDTSFYLWFGNNRATPYHKGAFFGQWQTWSGYRGVWHLQATRLDSSINQNHFVVQGSATVTTGKLKNGFNFSPNASLNKVQPPGLSIGGATSATVQIFFKTSVTGTGRSIAIVGDGAAESTFWSWLTQTSGNKFSGNITRQDGDGNITGTTTITDNVWHLGHISFDGTTLRLYVDGVEEANTARSGVIRTVNLLDATHGVVSIGNAAGTSNADWSTYTGFSGDLDEFRIAIAALSEDWAATEKEMFDDPEAFVVLGESEQTVTAMGLIVYTTEQEVEAQGRISKTEEKTITAVGNISGLGKKITARGRITVLDIDQTIVATSKIVLVGNTFLVTPSDEAENVVNPMYLVWEIPHSYNNDPVHSQLQVDKTDNTFTDVELSVRSDEDSGFEYWNGSSWEQYPLTGVTSEFHGNQARILVSLSSGTKFWRVRGGI